MSQAERECNTTNLSGIIYREIAGLTLDHEQDYADLLDKPSYEGFNDIHHLVELLSEVRLEELLK